MASRQELKAGKQHISPADFCAKDSDKTKLNWFLFEYACKLAATIQQDRRLQASLKLKGVDDSVIATFCIHYSKGMKKAVLDRVSHKTENIVFGYREIEKFFPHIGDALVDSLLTKAAEAWDSLTGICVGCINRCISERDRMTDMFDDPSYRK